MQINVNIVELILMLSVCSDDCSDSDSPLGLAIYHHTNITNILFRVPELEGTGDAVLLYIGHETCANPAYFHEKQPYRGITYPDYNRVAINYVEDTTNLDLEVRIMAHEIGHLFGAPDHYGSEYSQQDTTEEVKIKYGIDSFNDNCMYGLEKDNLDVINNLTICPGCQELIRRGASKYFDARLEYE